ncbi:MAG: sigma-70 family RNA polymerase sigma factor [Planctomycetes bacterium]|nr:sigma-70 family RNA polymerase sigma factor [Planctomycetota bacterium]
MTTASSGTILRHIHQLSLVSSAHELTDSDLLRRFAGEQDQAAFAALVGRHGPLVWRVCRAVLGHEQDAEDAFQATFVVLAKKGGYLRDAGTLAGWLYGVAVRIARRARRGAARRRAREQQARQPDQESVSEGTWRDVQAALDEEVLRLPEKLRLPFVLCFLEGRCQAEVARELGCRPGTVSARLSQARKELLRRLARRGVSLSAVLTAVALSRGPAGAVVPAALASSTVRAASACAAKGGLTGITSPGVAALVKGGVPTMFTTRGKLVTGFVLLAGLLVAGAGVMARQPAAADPRVTPQANGFQGVARAEKAVKGRLAEKLTEGPGKSAEMVEVRGRILGPDGKPFAGARLLFCSSDRDDDRAEAVVSATSGADGRFHLTAARTGLVRGRQLVAAADGYGPDWVEADSLGKGEVTLRLVRDLATPLSGRILDLEGRPVKDAVVRVRSLKATPQENLTPVLKSWSPDSNRISPLLTKHLYQPSVAGLMAVKTDADGRFKVRGVGADRVAVLRLEGPTIEHRVLYVLCRPGLDVKALRRPEPEPGLGPPSLPALYAPSFEHVARPTRPVAGKVIDRATGKPLADVHIGGHGAGASWEDFATTRTDTQGRYRLIGLPKGVRYGLRATPGLDRGYLPAEKSLADDGGLTPLKLDFEMVRGVRVRGRVTDKEGKPVPAALWYFPLSDNKFFRDLPGNDFYRTGIQGFRTEKDGTYSLIALPGSGVIKFRAEVEGPNPYTQVGLDPAHRKRAYREDDPGMGPCFLSSGGAIETLLGHNGYLLIEPALGTETLTCDVRFERGRTARVHVVGPDGKALTGATVSGMTALGGLVPVKGSSFTALALSPERPRVVTCVHAGRKLAGHVSLSGKESGPVTVQLRPGATLTGQLLDEEGKPIVGARVWLFYAADSARGFFESGIPAGRDSVKTNANGAFRVEGVFPGLAFGLTFVSGGGFREIGAKYRNLSLTPAQTRDLGNISSKPYPQK